MRREAARAWRIASPHTRAILVAAILIGLAERIGWALARRTPFAVGEAAEVAIALARGRGFADPFFPGQGATAHLLPTTPAIAGVVYALLGIRSPAAEAVLLGWALVLTFAAYALTCLAAARIGVPRRACFWAFVLLAVAPVYTTDEAFEWRVWEGGLGLTLATGSLLLLLRAEDGARLRGFRALQALLPALAFFVNPVMGVTAFAGWLLFAWRHRMRDGLVRPALLAGLSLALLIGPWTVRNVVTMGRPIPLRDDLGLELAVANHPAAVHPADFDRVFLDRLTAIQPYIHPQAQRRMIAAGGEIAYSQALGRATIAWMRAHPRAVGTLWARHLREMLFTRKWLFKTAHGQQLPLIRATTVSALATLALVGLAMAARRRDGRYLYAAAYLWTPTLLYVPFQPVIRYTWLIWPIVACLACDAIARAYRLRHVTSVDAAKFQSEPTTAPATPETHQR
ncbi:hypothetical protein [Sphingomonas sp.]|uniref:hypothetical protein n=1 Tax=Sphingomonas sp. TaxID=28214 RepID=UPI003AFF7B09